MIRNLLLMTMLLLIPFESPYTMDGAAILPNASLTPGMTDSTLTKEVLCDPKFRTGTVRHVTEKMKKDSCLAYSQTVGCPGKNYEIDHLISIELGGSNDPKNLWPEPVDSLSPLVIGYHTKDVVENKAHSAVCSGTISLEDAQKGISGNWYEFGIQNGWILK